MTRRSSSMRFAVAWESTRCLPPEEQCAIPKSFAFLLLFLPAVLSAQRPALSENVRKYVSTDTNLVAITGVTVIDGRGTPAVKGQTVVIRDGRIAEVGATGKVKAPAGALVVDGTGMTLIPGIVGMHDHMFYTAAGGVGVTMSFTGPRLYLASGVTSVRTTGTRSPYADINLRAAIDSGLVPGPRIHVTTPYLTGPEGGGSMSIAATPEQARRFVAYWAAEGATWVKFYTDISRAEMKAAIDEAHKQGIKATGPPLLRHLPGSDRPPHRRLRAWRAHGERLHRRQGAGQVPAQRVQAARLAGER